jgi:RNA polymerase sigma factor for flagellar operon FliA
VDSEAHDREFIEQYAAFVHGIVQHTRAQFGLDRDVEDLVSFGYQGLLEARLRFDPARSVQFKSFAYYRVRGAIIDGVRQMAYLPRRAYERLLAAEALDAEAEVAGQSLAVAATPASLEGNLRAIDGVLGRVAAAYTTMTGKDGSSETTGTDPEQDVLQEERRARVERALAGLPEQERFLLRGHYIDDRPFGELAKELGVSKSWASRMHTRALDRLRELLAAE